MEAPLDVYDLAFLAGGPDRVVDTALVALVQSGRVRVHGPAQLAAVDMSRRHPVEAAMLDAVGPAGHRSVDTIRWRLAGDERVSGIGPRLRHDGLLGSAIPPVTHLHGTHLRPSRKGRALLEHVTAQPPADDVAPRTDAMTVALGGRDRLPDRELCRAIFEAPRTVHPLQRGTRSGDPAEAAAEHLRGVQQTPSIIHGSSGHQFGGRQ
jgi:hypothetical protein